MFDMNVARLTRRVTARSERAAPPRAGFQITYAGGFEPVLFSVGGTSSPERVVRHPSCPRTPSSQASPLGVGAPPSEGGPKSVRIS